jgi:hypothetical protein
MTGLTHVGAAAFLAAIGLVLAVGVRRRNASVAVNSLVSLAAATLPGLVSLTADGVSIGPELTLWIAAAGFFHSLGMVGFYESTWWWDHLTHTLSAALVAALVYAAALVVADSSASAPLAAEAVVPLTVGFVVVAGVFWELLELVGRAIAERLDFEPLLIPYGRLDTALDLVFDAVGALLVITFDVRVFVSVADRHPRIAGTLLFTSGVGLAVGTILLAVVVALTDGVELLAEG